MPKIKRIAYESQEVAYAIVGQAIIDEGDIGQTSITLAYYSESMARHLWEIANQWELANMLHVKTRKNGARVWSFTVRASKRSGLYDVIGPLPDERKDRAFKHLLIHQPSGRHRYKRGEAKRLILQKLQKEGPMTRREIMYELKIRGGTVARHLLELKKRGHGSRGYVWDQVWKKAIFQGMDDFEYARPLSNALRNLLPQGCVGSNPTPRTFEKSLLMSSFTTMQATVK